MIYPKEWDIIYTDFKRKSNNGFFPENIDRLAIDDVIRKHNRDAYRRPARTKLKCSTANTSCWCGNTGFATQSTMSSFFPYFLSVLFIFFHLLLTLLRSNSRCTFDQRCAKYFIFIYNIIMLLLITNMII